MTLSAIKGALLGVGICALFVVFVWIVATFPWLFWVVIAVLAVWFVYCCALIGEQEKW